MGHLNDAQTFGLMRRIGTELCFPEQCVLLGDKIYPNENCIMTSYTATQLARKEDRMKRKCKKLNRNIRYYRIGVELAFAELKRYKIINFVCLATSTPTLITASDNMCGACVPKET